MVNCPNQNPCGTEGGKWQSRQRTCVAVTVLVAEIDSRCRGGGERLAAERVPAQLRREGG